MASLGRIAQDLSYLSQHRGWGIRDTNSRPFLFQDARFLALITKTMGRTDCERLTLRAEQESHARRRAGDMFARLDGESDIQEG